MDGLVLFLEGGELLPVEVGAQGGDGNALNFEQGLEGFKFGGGHAADAVRAGQFVEEGEVDAVADDAESVLMAEVAEEVDEGLVVDLVGDEDLALIGPAGGAEGLEEVGVAAFVADAEFELGGGEGDDRNAEMAFEIEEGFVEPWKVGLVGLKIPVGDDDVRDFPDAAVWRLEGEGVARTVERMAFDNGAKAGEAGGFLAVGEFLLEESGCGGAVGVGIVEAEVVALSLVDLGDGGGGIVGEDGKMITQGGVAVFVAEAEADEADEFGAFDGLRGIGGQNLRQDVAQLIAKTHVTKKWVEDARCGGGVKESVRWF